MKYLPRLWGVPIAYPEELGVAKQKEACERRGRIGGDDVNKGI